MKKLQPLGDRVLVKRVEIKEDKKGSLFIPPTVKEKLQEGEVVEVGPGKLDSNGFMCKVNVAINDHILFSSYAGAEVQVGEEEYLIINEDDILAKIENGGN